MIPRSKYCDSDCKDPLYDVSPACTSPCDDSCIECWRTASACHCTCNEQAFSIVGNYDEDVPEGYCVCGDGQPSTTETALVSSYSVYWQDPSGTTLRDIALMQHAVGMGEAALFLEIYRPFYSCGSGVLTQISCPFDPTDWQQCDVTWNAGVGATGLTYGPHGDVAGGVPDPVTPPDRVLQYYVIARPEDCGRTVDDKLICDDPSLPQDMLAVWRTADGQILCVCPFKNEVQDVVDCPPPLEPCCLIAIVLTVHACVAGTLTVSGTISVTCSCETPEGDGTMTIDTTDYTLSGPFDGSPVPFSHTQPCGDLGRTIDVAVFFHSHTTCEGCINSDPYTAHENFVI